MPAEVKANALTDVDVKFVSLVKRGAIRIPFRITKEDTGPMGIDFTTFFRKADDTRDALAKVAAAKLKKDGLGGTMPVPTNSAEAIQAAQEILKNNGFSVMVASADANVATPSAKSATTADQAASVATKKLEDEKAAAEAVVLAAAEELKKSAASQAAFAAMIADKKAKAKTKKDEADAAIAEIATLEKAAQSASPQELAAKVNAGPGKETIDGAAFAAADAEGGDKSTDEIAENPVINRDGQTDSKATQAILMKSIEELTKSVTALAELVKTGAADTAKKIAAVEATVSKSEATVGRVVLGAANEDTAPAATTFRKSSCPPLLDSAYANSRE